MRPRSRGELPWLSHCNIICCIILYIQWNFFWWTPPNSGLNFGDRECPAFGSFTAYVTLLRLKFKKYKFNCISYSKGGKWAISVAGDVCGTSRISSNCLPARATHTIFCHASAFIDRAITAKVVVQAGIYATTRDYTTKTISISWKKRLSFIYFKRHARRS